MKIDITTFYVAFFLFVVYAIIASIRDNGELSAYCKEHNGSMQYIHVAKKSKCVIGEEQYWKVPPHK